MQDIDKALYRKAVGYTAKEVVEEYGGESGELLRRKVSKKHVPPDMSAIKTYLERVKDENDLSALSDGQLERLKRKLLEQLQDNQEKK